MLIFLSNLLENEKINILKKKIETNIYFLYIEIDKKIK